MNRISQLQKVMAAMAVLMIMASGVAIAGPSPHTKAVLDGTMHKSSDGKGYILRVESAKAEDGTDLPDLKGKEVAMPADMSGDMAAACAAHCEKAVQIKCCIEDGKIAATSSVSARDVAAPGAKGKS